MTRCKRAMPIVLASLIIGAAPARAALIIDFDFSGVSGTVAHTKNAFELTATDAIAPHLDIVQGVNVFSPSVLTFSTGGGVATNDMNLSNWGTGTTLQDAINGNRYLSYTIEPSSGFLLNLNGATATFDVRRNGTNAPKDFYILAEIDGGTFDTGDKIGQLLDVGNTVLQTITGTLPGLGFDALSVPVEIRLYGVDANQTSGNAHISDARITGGTVVPIPEPTTLLVWSLLAGLGVGLHSRRGRR